VLLLARESGLLRLGTVSIDGTKIDANASKIRSVGEACPRAGRRPDPWDRAQTLRAKLAADIAALTAQAEAADTEDIDPQALPAEIVRRTAPGSQSGGRCRLRPAGGASQSRGRSRTPRIRSQDGGLRGQDGAARPPAQAARPSRPRRPRRRTGKPISPTPIWWQCPWRCAVRPGIPQAGEDQEGRSTVRAQLSPPPLGG
jgi:hypothetical protein